MGEKEDDVFWRRQPSLYEFETNPLEAKFSRVAVIGAGSVGAACASNLILLKTCSEVIMVDIDEERCEGEVLDLEDAGFISGVRCKKGTFEDAGSADIIVITAGVGQKPGESRVKLIEKNKSILKSIFDSMKPLNQEAIVLVVANPVDILTYLAQRLSGLSKHQVFGSGTFLDTQRFCRAVSGKLKVRHFRVEGCLPPANPGEFLRCRRGTWMSLCSANTATASLLQQAAAQWAAYR